MEVAAEIFEPFKDATLKLEASKTPTSHIAGRVMLLGPDDRGSMLV